MIDNKKQLVLDFLANEGFKNAVRPAISPKPEEKIQTPNALFAAPKPVVKPQAPLAWDAVLATSEAEHKNMQEVVLTLWGQTKKNVSDMKQTAEYADRNSDRDREIDQANDYLRKRGDFLKIMADYALGKPREESEDMVKLADLTVNSFVFGSADLFKEFAILNRDKWMELRDLVAEDVRFGRIKKEVKEETFSQVDRAILRESQGELSQIKKTKKAL
jgi:hypothetical protein